MGRLKVVGGLRDSFRSALPHGFKVVRQALSETDIRNARRAIADALDRLAGAMLTPADTSHPRLELEERIERAAQTNRAYAFTLLHAVASDTQNDPRMAGLAVHARLGALSEKLAAPEHITSRVIRVRASVPTFDSDRTHWHQDVSRLTDSKKGCESVRFAFWMPLTDVDGDSGALEIIPGRWDRPLPHRPAQDGRFTIPEDRLPRRPRRVIPISRGDILVLDRYIPHRALPTRNGRARWAIVMWISSCPNGKTH